VVTWSFTIAPGQPRRITVRHLRDALGPAGEELVGRSLAATLGATPGIVDVALPARPVAAVGASPDSAWVRTARRVVDEIGGVPNGLVCLTRPAGARGASAIIRRRVERALGVPSTTSGQMVWHDGSEWSVRAAIGSCDGSGTAATGGGTAGPRVPESGKTGGR
jgi:hypothetical protein